MLKTAMFTTVTQQQQSSSSSSAPFPSPHYYSSTTTSSSNSSNTSTSTTSSSNLTPPTTPILPFYWNTNMQAQPFEETPKISNHSKRRHDDVAISLSPHNNNNKMQLDRTESTSSLDCQSLQRSLKRVRLSSSPGELRLQLDLRHLAKSHGWTQTAEDVWHWPRTDCRLEQCQVDPLRLIYYIPHGLQYTRVWIQIPKMYPHRPPAVVRIQHAPGSPHQAIQVVHISMDTPPMGLVADLSLEDSVMVTPSLASVAASSSSVLEFSTWTCILRLTDVLEFLHASLGSSSSSSSSRQQQEVRCCWATAPPMPDARGFLSPNRFDLGYCKGNTNAMDLKE